MSLGPLIINIEGTQLTQNDIQVLKNPLVGGIILFARNFESSAQLRTLVTQIKSLREPSLLVSVDQEGGRVQRFMGPGFTTLPSATKIGQIAENDFASAEKLALATGWVMAAELLAHGIDLSYAPVIDKLHPTNKVSQDRCFGFDVEPIIKLAGAYITGMQEAGMACVLKHFPGHGGVEVDSHEDLPYDPRSYQEILNDDLQAFIQLINNKSAQAVMTAHVQYDFCDSKPVTYSEFWLNTILRQKLKYQGVIISDDLNMGACLNYANGSEAQSCLAALEAGCDLLLYCNNRDAIWKIIDDIKPEDIQRYHHCEQKLHALLPHMHFNLEQLQAQPLWQERTAYIEQWQYNWERQYA